MSVSTKLWAGFAVTVLLGAVLVYDLAEQFLLLAEDIRFSFESLDTLSLTPGERAYLERIEGLSERFGPVTRRFATALEQDRSRVYGPWAAQTGLEDWILELREETVLLTEASRAAMLEEAAASSRRAQTAERGAWLLAGFVLLFGAAATAAVARSLSSEVRRLAAGTRKVAEGDFEHRLTGAQEREFRQLESDFNLMIERLGEAEALKKDFVAAVSHDLKSPLASIQETLGLLLEEIPGPVTERQRRLLALAGKSSERLSTMISKLLELAQMEARVLRYDVRTVDLVPVVREVVEEAEPLLRDRDLGVELSLPSRAAVACDRSRIAEVAQNLLENAVKFSPRGSSIEIELTGVEAPVGQDRADSEDAVTLVVRDRGPGIPDAEKEVVFDRFVRRDGQGGPGVGLGLTICREIVTAHAGLIWVEDRPGGGSVFAVRLPRGSRSEREGTGPGPEARPEPVATGRSA